MLYKNKNAQASEAIVWLVATLIIIAVLVVSVYTASAISKSTKTVSSLDFSSSMKSDIVAKESLFAFLLTKNADGKNFYSEIESSGGIAGVAKELGINVFNKINAGAAEISLKFNKNSNAAGLIPSVSSAVVEKVNIDKNSAIELTIKYKTNGATIQ
ncbi:hypothetical protein HY449_01475 [Candidatus Pacearchaeota archaeon]|nr:hypothetical protein [Candidatus Pacearchaeota archaeon]